MTRVKRGRGRPPGASRLSEGDAKTLDKMVSIIVRSPMKPTTALRQLGISDYATTKRLQRKWRSEGPARIRAYEDRAALQQQRLQDAVTQVQSGATAAFDKFHAFMNSPEMVAVAKWIAEMASASKRFDEFANLVKNPVLEKFQREAEAYAKSPVAQQIQAFTNSPVWKGIPEARRFMALPRLAQQATLFARPTLPP